MDILYIHQYFATPAGKTGTRSYEFARRWVAAGNKVTMLTSIAQLAPDDLKNAQGRFIKRFTIEGIDVRAITIGYAQQMGFAKKVLAFLGFMIAAVFYVVCKQGYDIVYATSTPLTVGIPALCAKWLRRKKFVFEVRDQWPEIPIELGIIKNKLLIKILLWLEKSIYRNSSAIVAGSLCQAEGIKKVCNESKIIEVVPNGCDLELFRPEIDGSYIRAKYNWNKKLVFLHAGAMGKVNGLQFVIDAAEKLRANKDILFVLIGQGNEKAALEKRVAELSLDNVQILPPAPKRALPEVFAAADVGLVIIGNYPIIQHNSANKFFDSLSAGKPILLNYLGWQRDLLEKNQAGFGCTLYNIDEFAQNVLYLYKNCGQLAGLGRNARRIAVEQFNRDNLASQALSVIESNL